MKERLLSNWSIRRVIYLIIGIAILVQGILMNEWIGIAGGGYFTLMGLLGFGCAGGNCYNGACDIPEKEKQTLSSKN